MDNKGSKEEQLSEQEETTDMPIDVECVNEEVESSDEWCFETDHVVFKNNKDYLSLLKAISILEAQRMQAVKDMEKLIEIKEEALNDPMGFVKKMENGENLGIPHPITIVEVPTIDWSVYNLERPESLKHVTRNALRPVEVKLQQLQEESQKPSTVRGRAFDDSKPQTFNQLWTTAEQQRLEELLLEYPPEEVETKRWTKIAAALGNRTSKQVSSRVQKYFIKLHRAGLPVPGRIPKVVGMGHRHQHQRNNHLLFKPTTFFPSRPRMSDYELTHVDTTYYGFNDSGVKYNEDEGGEETDGGDEDGSDDDDDTMNIKEKVAEANTSRQLGLLKRVAEEKEMRDNSDVKHFGYKCDYCHEEPLIGTRWNCVVCRQNSVDFCTECVVTQVYSATPHQLSHRLEPIRTHVRPKTYDQDYSSMTACGYNYLDPNFMPSNDE